MPTLNWIGKEAVQKHHLEIPYRLLEYEENLSIGDKNSDNLIVQGDNLHALKALLPYYAGKVKCIYIDPPYNTGNEKWQYNDNVNAPEIREWLNKTVGSEGEDLSRHDKWLCMMYPRLQLLKKFLNRDGAIFISIDENEFANLKLLCDEIFGSINSLGIFVWKARSGKSGTSSQVAILHEYILCYAKDFKNLSLIKDTRIGKERREQLRQWGQGDRREDRPTMFYPIKAPDGTTIYPIKNDGSEGRWRVSKNTFMNLQKNDQIEFVLNEGNYQVFRLYPEGNITHSAVDSLILDKGSASSGTIELKSIFQKKVFDTTKPLNLIKYLIGLIDTDEEDFLILDSFAGSGTTGHAVLQLNKEDGGNRKFILIEMEADIARNITAERIKRVSEGYKITKENGADEVVEGLGGGFKYCKLADPLFDRMGNISESVKFTELARHIYFSETGLPLTKNVSMDSALLGIHKGTAIYLLFNGILGDKTVSGGNILTSKILTRLPKYDGPKIIFGEGCRLGASRLREENISFKQIPFEIKTS